jgi:hypothetical protein
MGASRTSIEAVGKAALADCQLCAEAALAGHSLLPSLSSLQVPAAQAVGVDLQSIPEFRLLSRTHGWLSRAPPQ